MSSTGWKSPGTVMSDDSVGTVAWSNPENAKVSDNSYAELTTSSEADSEYLKATNFGFSVPGGSTIDGVEVSYEDRFSGTPSAGDIKLVLFYNGSVIGNPKDSDFVYDVDTIQTLGNSNDLWGATLTVDKINSSSFGVAYYGENLNGSPLNFHIDHIQIKVYYTEGTEANSERGLYIKGGDSYSRESSTDLESDDTPLATQFSEQEYIYVGTDDDNYVDLQGTAQYMKFLFKELNENESNEQKFTITWRGKSSLAPSSATVYLQVYNRTSGLWETLDSDSSSPANTKFTLEGSRATNLSDYYDEHYVISVRVYQDGMV